MSQVDNFTLEAKSSSDQGKAEEKQTKSVEQSKDGTVRIQGYKKKTTSIS